MTLLNIVVILVLVGIILWLINAFIPMAGVIKTLLNLVVFVVVLIWLLRAFGIVIDLPGVHIPRLM
ncbi:MAG TPA: Thivi_2564 family membrane protein [Candidatus Binataceae bacterium]|nr:Thivi_2564 family membrane protein [Candidatus Binataceae bacterium]